MNTSSMTRSNVFAAILAPAVGVRHAGALPATREEAGAWPWPLPLNSVLAVFDDGASARGAIDALRQTGAGTRDLWVLSGEDGARQLREAFVRRGALSRLRSLLASESEILTQLETWCGRGATVVLVHAPHLSTKAAAAIAGQYTARAVRRTGRWASEWTVRAVAAPSRMDAGIETV